MADATMKAILFGADGQDVWRDQVDPIPGSRPEYAQVISRPNRLRSLGWTANLGNEALAELMMHVQD